MGIQIDQYKCSEAYTPQGGVKPLQERMSIWNKGDGAVVSRVQEDVRPLAERLKDWDKGIGAVAIIKENYDHGRVVVVGR